MARVFLDTSLLLQTILEKPSSAQDAKNLLYRLRSGYEVIIPQVVIAEAFSKIITKPDSDQREILVNLSHLLDHIQNLTDPNNCLPAPTIEVFTVAKELLEAETEIDLCDALIVGHAFVDLNSDYLLTTDGSLLQSYTIDVKLKELGQSRRTKDFRIRDSL